MNKKEVKQFLKDLQPLDMVLVNWVDAEKDNGDGWVDIGSAAPHEQVFVTAQTVGFFVAQSKTLLRLTSDYDPGNNKIYGYNDIQVANVQGIYKLLHYVT
jgi:hypothetical protein|tara:strand:+ start:1235 stop:1534 length:300 start_codon:yes stop_codon:yes gene_type:complete